MPLCVACMHVCMCDLARSLDHLLFLAAGWQGPEPQWGGGGAGEGPTDIAGGLR